MQALYTAVVTAKAGRAGHVTGEDGHFSLALAVPKGLGGPGGDGTNPEQLFAAGYAACFGQAAQLVCNQKKLRPSSIEVTATISLHKQEPGFALGAQLRGRFAGLSAQDAEAVMQAAHQICPYSRALRNNVEVALQVA